MNVKENLIISRDLCKEVSTVFIKGLVLIISNWLFALREHVF